MKNGFTLIEILAIIILLGLIATFTVPIVSSTINDSKDKAYQEQVNLIIEASKKWANKNTELLTEEDYYLNISTLLHEGFLKKSGGIKNPRDGSDMHGCVLIRYESEYQQYNYTYVEDC